MFTVYLDNVSLKLLQFFADSLACLGQKTALSEHFNKCINDG